MCDIYGNENIEQRIARIFSKLHRAVQREIEVRNKLAELRGMLDMLIQVSEMNNGKLIDNEEDDRIFGEVVVTPIPFTMDANGRNVRKGYYRAEWQNLTSQQLVL